MPNLFLSALLTPDLGLVFWTTVAFLIFFFFLRKYAWKHILEGVNKREQLIEKSFTDAKQIEENLRDARHMYEEKIREAEKEKRQILAHAESLRVSIIEEARREAQQEASRIAKLAEQDLANKRDKMLRDLREETVNLVLQTTEQILRLKLADTAQETEYVNRLLQEMTLVK